MFVVLRSRALICGSACTIGAADRRGCGRSFWLQSVAGVFKQVLQDVAGSSRGPVQLLLQYDSTNSHPAVFKVGEAGATTTSWVKKQQPQSVSACLDTVLHFWTWNGFGTDKCMACGTCSLSTTNIWRGTTFPTTTKTATCCTRGGISALQNSGILCFMPRKDGPLALWQQYRIGNYTRTLSQKMRAAVALHRGDILLFTGNFQRLMQHKAPSFATWSGQTAEQFMQCQRYPGTGRDIILISEEFEAAKRLSTWGARAVVTCRMIRSHEPGCPWRNLRELLGHRRRRRCLRCTPWQALRRRCCHRRRTSWRNTLAVVLSESLCLLLPAATQRPARLTVLSSLPGPWQQRDSASASGIGTIKAISPWRRQPSPPQNQTQLLPFLVLIRFVALISAWLALATALDFETRLSPLSGGAGGET